MTYNIYHARPKIFYTKDFVILKNYKLLPDHVLLKEEFMDKTAFRIS